MTNTVKMVIVAAVVGAAAIVVYKIAARTAG